MVVLLFGLEIFSELYIRNYFGIFTDICLLPFMLVPALLYFFSL